MKTTLRIVALTILFLCVFTLGSSLQAQEQQEEQVTIPKSMLTKQQLEEVTAKDMQARVKQYGSWVGIGHEVGVAVNEGLSAVTTQSNAFANTKVGKWTIFVIVFKVLGLPVVGMIFGFGLLIVGTPIWLWSFRKWLPHQVVDREILDLATQKVTERRYTKWSHDDASGWMFGHIVILFVMIGISSWMIFGAF
jgi:hypothetical protein